MSRKEQFEHWFNWATEQMVTEARRRVQLGAELLDERVPGWWQTIDLDRLYLSSTEHCVLGQLFDEPITVPAWEEMGFATLEAATARTRDELSGRDPRLVEKCVAQLSDPICVSNYEAGIIVLGFERNEDEDEDTNYDATQIAHVSECGFDEGSGLADEIYVRFDALDPVWHELIAARKQASVS